MPASRLAAIKKSTIVRSFALLERVAPAVGARWAEALWFRIPGPRGRRDRLAEPGRPFQVRVDGRTVAGEVWGDEAAEAVYLVHGWGGWGTQLDAFVGPLTGAGLRVVAFDAPSHGASDPGPEGPGRSTILELADALAAVVAANGPAARGGRPLPGRDGRPPTPSTTASPPGGWPSSPPWPTRSPTPGSSPAASASASGPAPAWWPRIERRVGASMVGLRPARHGRPGRDPAPAAGPRPPRHRDRLVGQRGHRPVVARGPAPLHHRPRPPPDPPRPGRGRRGRRVRHRAVGRPVLEGRRRAPDVRPAGWPGGRRCRRPRRRPGGPAPAARTGGAGPRTRPAGRRRGRPFPGRARAGRR